MKYLSAQPGSFKSPKSRIASRATHQNALILQTSPNSYGNAFHVIDADGHQFHSDHVVKALSLFG